MGAESRSRHDGQRIAAFYMMSGVPVATGTPDLAPFAGREHRAYKTLTSRVLAHDTSLACARCHGALAAHHAHEGDEPRQV